MKKHILTYSLLILLIFGGLAWAIPPSPPSAGGGGLASTDIDTSAEVLAIVTDETGSGALVFGTAPTFVTSVGLPNTITSAGTVTWTMVDNQNAAIAFRADGANDILKLTTTDSGPGATVTGFFTSTGLITGDDVTANDAITGLSVTATGGNLKLGGNDTIYGLLDLYGHATGSDDGGTAKFYTGADHDTTISYYQIKTNQDDFIIGPDTNVDFVKITAGTAMSVDGTLTANAFSGPLTGDVTGNAATATALAADPANCATGQVATGIAASGALSCTATPTLTSLVVDAGISSGKEDIAYGVITAYGQATGSTAGGIFYVQTAADYDTTIDHYTFRAVEDDLYIGPDTNTDFIKIAAGAALGVDGVVTATGFSGPLTGNADTASNLSGTPALPNGTTLTTQSAADKSTKGSTTAYVDTPTTQNIGAINDGAGTHAAMAIQPTANVAKISIAADCQDTNGCTGTFGEVGAVVGQLAILTNVGTYHIDLANQAGVLVLATTPFDLQTGESINLEYKNSQWYEVSRAITTLRNITIGGFTATKVLCSDGSGNAVVCTNLSDLAFSSYAPIANPIFTGVVDIPTDATTDAAGEVTIDLTTDQFRFYGGAARALPSVQYASFVIPAPAATDDIIVMKAPYGMTIISTSCIVQGTTSVHGQLQECDSAGANCADTDDTDDITCDADGAADDGTLSNPSIDSGDWIMWKTTSIADTPTFLTVTFKYTVVAD